MKKLLTFAGVFLITGSTFGQDVPRRNPAPPPKGTAIQSPQKLKSQKADKTYRQSRGTNAANPTQTPATAPEKKKQSSN